MKKIFFMWVVCFMLIALTACGDEDDAFLTPLQPIDLDPAFSDSDGYDATDAEQNDEDQTGTDSADTADNQDEIAESNSVETAENNTVSPESSVPEPDPELGTDLDPYVGEYNDYDNYEPNLEIQQNEDGTYKIQIGIFRTIWLNDCLGYATDSGIEFSTMQVGHEISGIITLEEDVATVTFTGGWSDYSIINEYRYYKISDTPNIYEL